MTQVGVAVNHRMMMAKADSGDGMIVGGAGGGPVLAGCAMSRPPPVGGGGSEPPEITILVVDDHRSFADLLAAALNNVPGLRCVGTARTAAEGISRAAELRPTIAVVDLQMPHQDGLYATRLIREATPDTMIAMISDHREQEWVSRSAKAGASAFLTKAGSLAEMIDVLRRATPGRMLVAQSTYRNQPSSSPSHTADDIRPALTPRESEVLRHLGRAIPADGIAQVMGISLNTSRGYLKSVLSKLGASSQLEAVVKAQKIGLIGSARQARTPPAG